MNLFFIVTDCFPIVQSTWHFYLINHCLLPNWKQIFMKKDVFHSPLIFFFFFHISRFYFIQKVSMQVNSWSSSRNSATQCRIPKLLSCSWHKTTNLFSPNQEYFLTIFCVMIFFIDADLQDLEKVSWFQYKNLAENNN